MRVHAIIEKVSDGIFAMGIDRTKTLSGLLYPRVTLCEKGDSALGTRKGDTQEKAGSAPHTERKIAHQLEDRHLGQLYQSGVESRIERQLRFDESIGKYFAGRNAEPLEKLTVDLACLFLTLRESDAGLTWKEFRDALLRNFKPEQTGLDRSEFELATGAVHARIEMILASERFGTEIPDLGGSSNAE